MAAEQNANLEAYLHDVEQVFTELIPSRSNYSVRQEQVKMALATAEAIASGGVLLAQAGTGVGKTLAYLIPSVIWRTKYGGGQTLIATYTTNLQQQIFDKDYPFVRDRLGISFRLIQALGRTRYLCLMRFYRMLQNSRQYPQYTELLEYIGDCIETDNYSLFHPELQEEEPLRGLVADFRRLTKRKCAWDDSLWPHICAESLSCTKRSCRYFHSCYFYKERALLGGADICVANHALLCAVLRQDSLNRLVPQIGVCIIDEAHHFEDVAIEQMSNAFDGSVSSEFFTGFAAVRHSNSEESEDMVTEASEQMALIDDKENGDKKASFFVEGGKNIHYPPGWFSNLAEAVRRLGNYLPYGAETHVLSDLKGFYYGAFQALRESVAPYFRALEDYYSNEAYSRLECFERKSRVAMLNSQWLSLSGNWGHNLAVGAEKIKSASNNCAAQLREIEGLWKEIAERAEIEESNNQPGVLISTALEQLDCFIQNFQICHDIDNDTDSLGHWMEKWRGGVRLRAAKIDISDYLASAFWSQIPTAIATSATLKIDNSFDFFCSRTGVDKIEQNSVKKLSFSSPFHYEYQALLAVASDLGRSGLSDEAGSDAFLSQAVRFIAKTAKLWQGRMLILATSRYEVEKIYEILQHPLARSGIILLKQSSGLRAEQIERLRRAKEKAEKIVLVGTDSFWEGVDVAGEALSCVVILRLPFTSPDNPFFKIRSKSMGDQAFRKYAIPLAVLKFCQGFGRLVRTEKDRGVVFVLDNRLDLYSGKNYRHHFLHSLPSECPIIYNKSDVLAEQAYQWFRTGLLSADFLW